MAEIEERARKRKRKRDIKHAILGTVQAAALLGAAIVMPELPRALQKMGMISTRADAGVVSRARARYIKSGLIAKDSRGYLRTTEKGRRELAAYEMRERAKRGSRRWDSRWRILIFDIPEYRKGLRQQVRRSLVSVGFMRLQDSVWIYPYDCENFVVLLKANLKVGKDMLYMIVDDLEGDRWIRSAFGLPTSN
jgi:DNA-binding transcriptional regulator PaaX